jgi:hypothetical protein
MKVILFRYIRENKGEHSIVHMNYITFFYKLYI